jgi:hypothetical protein
MLLLRSGVLILLVTTTTAGAILPLLQPSPVRTIVFSTPSTSGSGSIPLSASSSVSFTQSVTCPPFSYGMVDFDTNLVVTYSTLNTMGLGARSSNTPIKGSTMSTNVPFDVIPYGGGHIPPPSPSLGGAFQQPIGSNTNYRFFGGGSLGPSSYTTLVGSMLFSLFVVLGNNVFSSTIVPTGGKPIFGQ